MHTRTPSSTAVRALPLLAALLFAAVLSACGAGGATRTSLPTRTPIPTYEYIPPTEAPQIQTAVAATAVAAAAQQTTLVLNAELVERGRGRYEALECGSCHGAKGEGVAGKGSAIVPTTLTEGEFITFMRSGGNLGNDHLYSTNRLSTTGGTNLYLYLVSLGQ